MATIELIYDRGTIVFKPTIGVEVPHFFKFDKRVNAFRALAIHYSDALDFFKKRGHKVVDHVLNLVKGDVTIVRRLRLRDYQGEALRAWLRARSRGVIVLPTGSGKTIVALAAIAHHKCPTLVVVPTLELMDQWESKVRKFFSTSLGRYGGGKKEIGFITISTYDSAYINAETLGNKFRLIVFDEVHHLPSSGYRQIAELSAAPYRLGLTATPEREDGLHVDFPYLVGEVVYRRGVRELSGRYLASFDVVTIKVKLKEEEKREYERLVKKYKAYLRKHGIRMKSIKDFESIIMRSGLDKEAREALLAWREARKIAFNASEKMRVLKEVLAKHKGDKVIIFTENTEMVRRISEELLIPEITYKTNDNERKIVLEGFRTGKFRAIVTSRVLEEGVDVPDANVAIILSGTGSRREFIQRLGRVLRPKDGRAILYELVTARTGETRVSSKRKRALGDTNASL